MDEEQGPQLKAGIPRLTRLAVPRASHDNLRLANTASKREPVKSSNLPRPSRNHVASIVPPSPLGENQQKSLRDRYGWNSQSSKARSRSPVRDALEAAQSNLLETTPPSSNGDIPIFEDGNENPVPQQVEVEKKKPRHRMSLSERTIETLSQISPSPSPTRKRRESLVSNDGRMGPPPRPTSSMRGSRPTTSARSRSQSPVKQPFRPQSRLDSPTKDQTLPAVPSPGSLFSPPRALVKGGSSRIAKPMRDTRRSVSNVAVVNADQSTAKVPKGYTAQTMRVKASHHDKSHANSSQQSLEAIFKDPTALTRDHLAVNTSNKNTGLLRPRSRGENTIATSPSPKTKKQHFKAPLRKAPSSAAAQEDATSSIPGPKSSVALRESIAKAKAARKTASAKPPSKIEVSDNWSATDDFMSPETDVEGPNRGLLRKRIDGALASGQLNISAMKLNKVPDEVMSMYEPSELSVNWAEVVDLTKFIVADNEIVQLEDSVFPDFSPEEVADDDENSNQFGGLEILDLRNNLLQSIPIGLRRLERLTSLNLSGNKLSNASLDVLWQLPRIQDLNLARNQLNGIINMPNSVMANIRVLSLQGNQIETLAMTGNVLSPIARLDVSSNLLTELPWEILSSFDLVQLNASANQLSIIALNPAVGGFTSLKELDLSRNTIEAIEPELTLSELQIFKINGNKLDSLPLLSTFRSLITIQASENNLSELPQGLPSLNELKSADFGHNNIKIVDPRIARMETLTSLQLAGNPLQDRKYLTMDTEELKNDLLKRMEPACQIAARDLQFQSNGLLDGSGLTNANTEESRYLFKPVNGILDLGSKSITSVNLSMIDLDPSIVVHTLRLSNNELTTFPIELLSHPSLKWSLKSLDLSHNPLASTIYLIDDLFLPTLQSLYIVSTGLTSLDALTTHFKAPELKELNISCHRLAGHVPWVRAWFPKCTTLLATDNWFSSVDVEGVRGLEVLDVRNNEIETLPSKLGLFGNYANKTEPGRLRSFECGGNKFRVPRVTVIEKGTEAVLRDLRRMVPVADVPEEWKKEI